MISSDFMSKTVSETALVTSNIQNLNYRKYSGIAKCTRIYKGYPNKRCWSSEDSGKHHKNISYLWHFNGDKESNNDLPPRPIKDSCLIITKKAFVVSYKRFLKKTESTCSRSSSTTNSSSVLSQRRSDLSCEPVTLEKCNQDKDWFTKGLFGCKCCWERPSLNQVKR